MLGGQSFVAKTIDKVSTVVRNSLVALTQEEKNEAGEFYDADTGEIEYAEVADNNFGPNWLIKKGASAAWMAAAMANPLLKEAIRRATGNKIFNRASEDIALNEERDETSDSWGGVPIDPLQYGSFRSTNDIHLRYPLNHRQEIDYDYLKVDCIEYLADFDMMKDNSEINKSNALTMAGADERMRNSKIIGTVFLPMQPGLSDSMNVDWASDTLNPLQVAGAKTAEDLMDANLGGAGKTAGGAAAGAISDTDSKDIKAFFAGKAVGAQGMFTRATGKVINPNLELIFKGPQLRTFSYQFRFTPREQLEAKEVRKIIRFFKRNMAVRRSPNKLFLKTPNVFKLKYCYMNRDNHPYLNKIKTCALSSFTVDYTPDGSYSTYEDGSMTSYNVGMTFNELNPIYEDDYGDVAGETSSTTYSRDAQGEIVEASAYSNTPSNQNNMGY
tara:strand:- start:1498 stop:2823 length:1326 start_codon:yes stop_codon:yes gene_type:complete